MYSVRRRKSRWRKKVIRPTYPVVWAGNLHLSRLHSQIEIRFLFGDPAIYKDALLPNDVPTPCLRIQYYLPLEKFPQSHIEKKMEAKEGSCMLLAVAFNGIAEQMGRLDYQFIHYLKRKEIVGVAAFPQNENKPDYKMLIFPPSDFVYKNIEKIAPQLSEKMYKQSSFPHLMCLVSPFGRCSTCDKDERMLFQQEYKILLDS